MFIKIKPLSINEAFKGRRYKTDKYKYYSQKLYHLLPKDYKIPEGKLALFVNVGYSNSNSDIDNFLKPFIDILQKKYHFNDNRLYLLHINKKVVKKNEEFIHYRLGKYRPKY